MQKSIIADQNNRELVSGKLVLPKNNQTQPIMMEMERKTKLAIHWKQALIEVIKLDPSLIGSRPDLITGNVQIRLRPTRGLSLVA